MTTETLETFDRARTSMVLFLACFIPDWCADPAVVHMLTISKKNNVLYNFTYYSKVLWWTELFTVAIAPTLPPCWVCVHLMGSSRYDVSVAHNVSQETVIL